MNDQDIAKMSASEIIELIKTLADELEIRYQQIA